MPELTDLLDQFEQGDPEIEKHREGIKTHVQDLDKRGFSPEPRHDIISKQQDRVAMLNANISEQRAKQATTLAGMIQDLNELTKGAHNKMYLK